MTQPAAEGQAQKSPFTCIVADDSEFARKNIARIVSMIGGSVVGEARNGREALELYDKHNPDLVLLDITMPELNGVEVLQKILQADSSAKVIMVSSIGHKDMVWKAISLGAKQFVTKPYTPDYAGMVIRSVVDSAPGGTA